MVIKSTSLETNLAKNTYDEMIGWVIVIYVKSLLILFFKYSLLEY